MPRRLLLPSIILLACSIAFAASRVGAQTAKTAGTFEGHTDVGTVLHAGSVVYDPDKQSYTLSGSGEGQPAGGWLRIPLQGMFYVGLGVCSHDKDVVEQAVFSNVQLIQPPPASGEPVLYSTLETVAIDSADRRVSYLSQGRFEAPNWTPDGSAFLFNREGRLERLAVNGDKPV